MDVNRRNIGVSFREGSAIIKLWAPLAGDIALHILDSGKKIHLQKDEYGYWTGKTPALQAGDKYKFIIDGEKELPDPASLYQPESVHGPSQAIDTTNFRWTDDTWNNISLDQYIIYELHTGTFTPQHNFAGIAEKLNYLKELGITAIEIMPVAQFPGARNWGYDGVYPFSVQDTYGGPHELQKLVDICHSKGLSVILDVVYNHMGPEGNYLREYGPYFTDKYHTPWGDAINFDDAWCDGVRDYFIENTLMWFRDFHIDALRMDAVHAIKDYSPVHILRQIKQKVDELMEATGRRHYLIVECDLNDARFINVQDNDGYGMDAQWIDEFHHSLRVASGNERNGYYADFNGLEHLAKAYKDAYVYNGIYSPHRKKTFGTKTDNPGSQFVVFSQNHDQVGNRMLGERTSELVSFEMQKLLAGAVLVSPYIPLLFMGEEYAETNPFQYFVSHTDPQLVEAVKKGRKEEFASFHTGAEVPDPQSEQTFKNSSLQWDLHKDGRHKIMLDYYKAMIALRKQNSVLSQLDRDSLDVSYDEKSQTLILSRWHRHEYLVCLMNFSRVAQTISLPTHHNAWKKIFDSADPAWLGPMAASSQASGNVTIQPESLLIYTA